MGGDKCLILSGRIDKRSCSLAVATFEMIFSMLFFDLLFDQVELSYHQYDDIDSINANLHAREKNYRSPMLYDYRNLQDALSLSLSVVL